MVRADRDGTVITAAGHGGRARGVTTEGGRCGRPVGGR